MKIKLIKIFIMSGLAITILVGCSNTQTNQQIGTLTEQNKVLSTENKELKDKIQILEQEKIQLKEKQKQEQNTENKWPIYTADIDTLEKSVLSEVDIDAEASLETKLQEIGNKLSKECFNGLPIQVKEIQNIESKKIAIINLKEDKNNELGWTANYFQGSTGGMITTTTLVESFLQKQYTGEWIDGVKFLCEDEKITFEHIPDLENIIYK